MVVKLAFERLTKAFETSGIPTREVCEIEIRSWPYPALLERKGIPYRHPY
jgi:hypothetical protein